MPTRTNHARLEPNCALEREDEQAETSHAELTVSKAYSPDRPAQLKLLFALEGFTDIRFVIGLSQISDLTLLTPEFHYRASGLDKRLTDSGCKLNVVTLGGGRLAYQWRSLFYLWRNVGSFNVVLAQELLRIGVNASVVGRLRHVPVAAFTALPALEYFNCRRYRKQIGPVAHFVGAALIRILNRISGSLATRTIALGPYLTENASKLSRKVVCGQYYGVDTNLYSPVNRSDKAALRRKLDLPESAFLVFLSSRISHEKDPETALRAIAKLRSEGINAILLNLGGGYTEFLKLAHRLELPDCDHWIIGRPPAHPMGDLPSYYQAADCTVQSSLEEGLGMSPLESLACGVPAVCSAVGGMAKILKGYARLVPREDAESMSRQLQWVAANPYQARDQALQGRNYVQSNWTCEQSFSQLKTVLADL